MKEILTVTQEADHHGNIACISDVKCTKGREVWKYHFEFHKTLKEGKTYKITVEELA